MSIEAWWFGSPDDKLGYGDGRKAEVGVTHSVDGEIVPCKNGLHGSMQALDALCYGYGKGSIVWRVKLHGRVVKEDDKHAASHRTYLGRIDASKVFDRFARECALKTVHLWEAPEDVTLLLEEGGERLMRRAYLHAILVVAGDNCTTAHAAASTTKSAASTSLPGVRALEAAYHAAHARGGTLDGGKWENLIFERGKLNQLLEGMLNRAIK